MPFLGEWTLRVVLWFKCEPTHIRCQMTAWRASREEMGACASVPNMVIFFCSGYHMLCWPEGKKNNRGIQIRTKTYIKKSCWRVCTMVLLDPERLEGCNSAQILCRKGRQIWGWVPAGGAAVGCRASESPLIAPLDCWAWWANSRQLTKIYSF